MTMSPQGPQVHVKEAPRPKTLKGSPTQWVKQFQADLEGAQRIALHNRDGLKKSLEAGESLNFNSLKDLEKSLRFWENAEGYAKNLIEKHKRDRP